MLTKRIIPCLDIKDGRTVKGTNFIQLHDAGNPVELAVRYCEEGADELVFLDITATTEKRKTLAKLVKEIATHINIPFTVGGGINTSEDVSVLLENGADKISVNTSAAKNPQLIDELAKNFGSQCVVVAIDAKLINHQWMVVTHGGRTPTEKLTIEWAKEVTERGAGEILLTYDSQVLHGRTCFSDEMNAVTIFDWKKDHNKPLKRTMDRLWALKRQKLCLV